MKGYFILFAAAIAADTLSQWADLPVPGAVLGLVGLAGWFVAKGGVPEEVAAASRTLLNCLALLLVPVGVSVLDLAADLNGTLALMVAVSIAALIVAVIGTVAILRVAQLLCRAPAPTTP